MFRQLLHGSFSSILTNLGQQALELQLERFFTVWAWKWDIGDDIDFGGHLGPYTWQSSHMHSPEQLSQVSPYTHSIAPSIYCLMILLSGSYRPALYHLR